MLARKLSHASSLTAGSRGFKSTAHWSNMAKKSSRLLPSLPMGCCNTAAATRSGWRSITPKLYGPPMQPPSRWTLSTPKWSRRET